MGNWLAEIIAIGDELVSGQRLDTNTQWISQRLEELGIQIGFHSTVGDDLGHNEAVFRNAVGRANIVICSGGLGPTADDLTREVISTVAGVPLERDPSVVKHIEKIFAARQRPMPTNNLCQADFPAGSRIVPNPEGTAPGIDLDIPAGSVASPNSSRIFALPGVPAELKQMWAGSVDPALRELTGNQSTIEHYHIHCFGDGESQIEMMLPDLVRRGRDPSTGITASAATITLRVSTSGKDSAECQAKMLPVVQQIRECLGDLVYGENGQQLEDVVVDQLGNRNLALSILDVGLLGDVSSSIQRVVATSSSGNGVLHEATVLSRQAFDVLAGQIKDLESSEAEFKVAKQMLETGKSDFAIVIGPLDRTENAIENGTSEFGVAIAGPAGIESRTYRFRGHSSWRQQRAVKQVLNQLRLNKFWKS